MTYKLYKCNRPSNKSFHVLSFSVPSRSPTILRVTSFEFTSDLLVEWIPLSQYYANGKLLGYTIYYRETSYYWSTYQSVNTSGPYPTQVKLKDLKPGRQYGVRVAAFTSKGVGPWSYSYYATTGMHLEDNSLCMSHPTLCLLNSACLLERWLKESSFQPFELRAWFVLVLLGSASNVLVCM